MKHRFIVYGCIAAMSLLFSYCGSTDDQPSETDKAILSSPAYKGLTDSIQQAPDDATLRQQRALRLSQNNYHELATADYKKAWELDPSETTAMDYVSNLLLVKQVPEAIDFLQMAIKKYPNNPEFNRRLAEIYAQTGEQDKAIQQVDHMLAKDSADFEAWLNKAMLLAQQQDTVGAIKALEQSFALQPVTYTGVALANLYVATLNPRALAICNELIQRDSTNVPPDAYYLKGAYYSDTHQPAKAITEFDKAIEQDWKFVDAYIDKGIILFEQKKYPAAIETLQVGVTVSSTTPDCYFWLGRCYEAMGQKEKAASNYETALSLDRNFSEAREHLEQVQR